jgi:hypothetical protein
MTHIRVFPKEALIMAANIGVERGFNRSLCNKAALTEFEADIDAAGGTAFPVTFNMEHEHIAGKKVDPHIRAVIALGKGNSITLDVDLALYNLLPVFDTDANAYVEEG